MASAAASACQCSAEGRTKRVLIVKKLHPAVTMQSLLTTFGAFGAITGCKVFTHKSGRSAGCASVEFASHQSACTAYGQLQGAQLHGKSICLQWFDQSLTAASPMRSVGGILDVGSPMNDNGRSARRHSLQLLTPGSGAGALAGQSPFSVLTGSPHHSYMHSAAAAAAQQQQMAALMAGAGQRSQQHMLRQASAPLSSSLQNSLAGIRVPASPFSGAGSFDVLASPSPMHAYDSSRGNLQDPASVAAAAAAAAVNLSAAMAAASVPMQGGNDFAILQQLAALQQQQQLAALALQQTGNTFSPQLDFQQASPLSPTRSLQHHHQQQQQHVIALAALQSQQQQVQAQLLQQQQQQQQQVASPAPAISRLQLARSMPAALSGSFGSLCSSSDGHMQAHSCNMFLQQQRQHETPGSAGSTQQTSPFALSQLGVGTAADAGTDTSSSAGGLTTAAAAASEGGVDTSRQLDAPSAAASGNAHVSKFAQNAKKQLFGDGSTDGLPLLQADGSWSAGFGSPAKSAGVGGTHQYRRYRLPRPRHRCARGSVAAGAGVGLGAGWGSKPDQQVLSPGTPGLLTSLQSYPSAPLPSTSPVLHPTSEQLARAAALEQQQQQLLAAAYGTQQPQHLPPTSRSQQARGLRHSDAGLAGSDALASRLSNMRVKDARASDSQLLGAYNQWEANSSRQVLSPGSAAAGRSPSNDADAVAYAAVQAWQQGVAALTGQQQLQQQHSSPAPTSSGCRFKHKQQLQLQMPELNATTTSLPMMSTAVPGGWEHNLIGTDVLPESPAATLPCRTDLQAALLAANAARGSSGLTAVGGQTWGNMDWSSDSSLSALLSPVHVANLAGRRWTTLTGDVTFGSNTAQSSSNNNVSNNPSAANSGSLPPRWGAAAMGRSSSCGLRTVSEDQALSGTAADWGLGSTPMLGSATRHSSLCLDTPGQPPPSLQLGSGDPSGVPLGSVYREVSLDSNNTEPVIGQGSCGAGDTVSGSVSSPAQAGVADSVLFSSGSFTFTPHLLQQNQQGSTSSTAPPPAEDDAVITEPFQMPAFFRPSRSSQDMTGTGSPVKVSGHCSAAAGAGAGGGGAGGVNGASTSSDDSPTKGRGSALNQQLQTALSHSSEGSSTFEGSPVLQQQPSGPFKGQSQAVQVGQLCKSSEDVPEQGFRRMWGSGAGDTP